MGDSQRPSEVPTIALNVPPPSHLAEENGSRGPEPRHTMGSPEEPDDPYYRLPPTSVRCPVCRVGTLKNRFTGCGVFLGVLLFPLGLVPCFLMRERRCNHCKHRPGAEEEPWPE
ncbi:brain protein I3-like [Pollicipes pollicipes]|uniref:brain protein I3-like n=1 Tax=Pollicipes pollicipes TaxID=41117 RepID=UPI0018850F3B|nr:brain protein I3-like [Pollicipes pollicipes]